MKINEGICEFDINVNPWEMHGKDGEWKRRFLIPTLVMFVLVKIINLIDLSIDDGSCLILVERKTSEV